jgi:hypothetical protein
VIDAIIDPFAASAKPEYAPTAQDTQLPEDNESLDIGGLSVARGDPPLITLEATGPFDPMERRQAIERIVGPLTKLDAHKRRSVPSRQVVTRQAAVSTPDDDDDDGSSLTDFLLKTTQ